jgi:hypothetical protein
VVADLAALVAVLSTTVLQAPPHLTVPAFLCLCVCAPRCLCVLCRCLLLNWLPCYLPRWVCVKTPGGVEKHRGAVLTNTSAQSRPHPKC